MTDYRDFQNSGLGATDPNRTVEDYRRRTSGSTGLIVALTVIALLIVSFIVFAAQSPDNSTAPESAPVTESAPGTVPNSTGQAPVATPPATPDATAPSTPDATTPAPAAPPATE